MIIYVQLDVSSADLRAAAEARGMTVTQFVAAATCNAVEEYKRRETARQEFIAALQEVCGVIPGGD